MCRIERLEPQDTYAIGKTSNTDDFQMRKLFYFKKRCMETWEYAAAPVCACDFFRDQFCRTVT
jgi:hypothetical protein